MYKGPFKWWVQSVMPVVFDDSLSYYEVLAKLTKYIEGLTGDVDQIEKILATIEGIEDITEFTKFLETIKTEIGNLDNLQTANKDDLVSAINEIALKANNAYVKPSGGIPENDLSQGVQDKLNRTVDATKYIINNRELKAAPSNNSPADLGLGTYSVPQGGIPWDTLSQDVQHRINAGGSGTGGATDYTDLNNKPQINGHTLNAGNNTAETLGLGTYSKPSAGIPESDLTAEVQEKLNTSGGIADSETNFVATRDYEAGELIYINGVLYKTKYKILTGTNLVPGNNIEVTDISAEIERINSEIDALQSGSGPDSWNLTAVVESESSDRITNFFEYFNCIGGENYNFILDPVEPTVGYAIKIYKRDGTLVHNFDNTTYPQYVNRQRFTFTPNDTGEYYCAIQRSLTGGDTKAQARVTIEYTQSQGISELWAQVNTASQLEPRVGALETLAVDLDEDATNLKSTFEKSLETYENDEILVTAKWEQGLISSTTGQNINDGSLVRCRISEYFTPDVYIHVDRSVVPYGTYLYYYDANKTFIQRGDSIVTERVVPLSEYPFYRVACLDNSNFDNQISAADTSLYYTFYKINKPIKSLKTSVNALQNGLTELKAGGFVNGHLTETGIADTVYTDYRLSTKEVVALPSGSSRKVRVSINSDYLVAMRTGARSDNLSHNLYWYTDGDIIDIPDGDNYYAISCCVAANNAPTSYVNAKISETDLKLMDLHLFVEDCSIDKDDEAEKVINASRLSFYTDTNPNTLNYMPVIAHTSDCHGDYTRVKNFLNFCDRVHVDLAAITGDIVSYKPSQGLGWFKSLVNNASSKVGVCVGNHDAYDDSLDDAGVYSLVFDGIASKIGNTTGKTWYYVDIADKALRVISVNLYQYGGTNRNSTHFTEEQLAWLCSTLASTPSGYGVVLLYHSPQVNLAESQNHSKFYQPIRKYANIYSAVNGSPINDIVDAFIGRTAITKTYTQTGSPASVSVSGDFTGVDTSAEFIAHLTGHFHQDSVCYVPGTTHLQLMLNVVCTNAIYGGSAYPYLCDLSDLPRNNEDATQNSFNVYAIDRREGVVRITRVGSNMTYTMQKRDYMQIPYKS